MRRLIGALIVVVVLGIVGGLAICAIPRIRDAATRSQCQNNLKQIGLALSNYYGTYERFPSATIPNEDLPCGKRLSWLVDCLAFMEQQQAYGFPLNSKKGWQDEENICPEIHDVYFNKRFRCPADPIASPPGAAGLTNYVGISGIGVDAAELRVGYPGVGFFGCERKLKLEDIKDGTANTLAVMETNVDLGPWTAGGFPTVRSLDPAMVPYLGTGRPFANGHRGITQAVFTDGSVRSLTNSIHPEVLEALATIAGGEKTEPLGD
ncbi:MAG TPA: DUF1559 domain-containing protein [Gemmataceae bacterium]|jgi:type II secretory pathway pseudopilin PulG